MHRPNGHAAFALSWRREQLLGSASCSFQSIECLFEQRAQRQMALVRHSVETINRFRRRLEIELPVAPGCVDATFAA
jgi:hypothetical protein